jgi:hypothetical protein
VRLNCAKALSRPLPGLNRAGSVETYWGPRYTRRRPFLASTTSNPCSPRALTIWRTTLSGFPLLPLLGSCCPDKKNYTQGLSADNCSDEWRAPNSVPPVTRPEPLPDQWYSRDLLVLREVARAFAADPQATPEAEDIAETLGLDEDLVGLIGESLKDAGYVDGISTASDGIIIFTKITPVGRREVGLWPSPEAAADRLLAALDEAIERAPEGEQRTRLQQARGALGKLTRDVLVGVASGAITGGLGG